jgi:anti-sigma factor ChrR (cupin superfamily)
VRLLARRTRAGARAAARGAHDERGVPQLAAEAEAEGLIGEVERSHLAMMATAGALDATMMMLQKAAEKKMQQRFATTRKAIAERDEATLRERVEKLSLLKAI